MAAVISMGALSPEESQDDLVARYRATHDRGVFETLWAHHEGEVRAFCRGVLKDSAAAQDAAQECMMRAIRRFDDYHTGNFPAWLHKIAYHVCIDHLRLVAARRETPLADATEPASDGPDPHLSRELTDLIDTLPRHQAVCLKLFYFDELSYAEIAACMAVPKSRVKSYVQNGRRMLRRAWERSRNGRT